MKIPGTLVAYRPLIKEGLEIFIERHRHDSGQAWKTDVMKRLRDFAVNGKLMRGCLVCYSYEICGGPMEDGRPPVSVIKAAIAIELIHCGLLIHDDIIDRDNLRRGRAAIHRQYALLAADDNLAQASRLGENLALCAGDTALFLAFEPLAESGAGRELMGLFAGELAKVCGGQMQDIYLGAAPAPPSKKAIYEIMRTKTATYSVALPLLAGAVLAGQDTATRRQLYAIGLAAGTTFQIRDDELGVFGQSTALGKPTGSDIREGKKTLLYHYLWRAAKPDERQRLAGIFGNRSATDADIKYVRQAIRQHEVLTRLRQDIAGLEATAFSRIDKLALGQTSKNDLKRMVRFCAARQF